MMWEGVLLVLLALTCSVRGQDPPETITDCRLINGVGCKMIRDPTYLVLAPRKIRPMQVMNVFASILKLEYKQLDVTVSVVKGDVQYADTKLSFDREGSRVLQMLIPSSLTPGKYKLRVTGSLSGASSGFVFRNETDIEFDQKRVSVFIQLSKPIYRQGQTVRFRVVPILPNLMPSHGSMTIFVMDPSGFAARRWLGQQTNAGGFVNQSFELADQPTYGDWKIKVSAFGYNYERSFKVIEFWEPRFDVNVTVPPYVMDDVDGIRGIITANHTSGRAVVGNATITVTIVPPNGEYNWRDPYYYPTLKQTVEYFEGRIDIYFSKQDLLRKSGASSLENMEFFFNATTHDWFLAMERSGYGSTFCYTSRIKLQWVGDPIRTFKPGSIFVATVALMYEDGTPVLDERQGITVVPTVTSSGGFAGSRNPVKKFPVNGLASFAFEADTEATMIKLVANYEGTQSARPIELRAHKYHSPSKSYISVTTSTKSPKVNQYIIFHVKTSLYVPKIYYQIVSQGNILIGDELQMISRQKTFSIALSRDMVPSARIIVFYIRQPEEIVVDALNFFVNGTRLNPVSIRFNRGKDFTRHTVEVNAFSDPGSYAAFSAIPYDLYNRGLNDGISENKVIDELLTYDYPANGSYLHKWRINENEFQYNFFTSNGYGVDANKTFFHAGLTVLTDADVTTLGIFCEERGLLPCFDGINCYGNSSRCDRVYDCPQDWADEQGCIYEEPQRNRRSPLDRISHVMRFYDDSSWLWNEKYIKPDGRIDFRVNVPRYPLTWVVNGFSLSQEKGFGMMESPARYDATRLMYIQVEAPEYIVRGEQIGFRVTVFNYWFADDYLEVIVKLHGSPYYKFVHVEEYGIVNSYSPRTSGGDHETIVFLEPGESKDIYMPVVATSWEEDRLDVTISATSYLSSDVVTKTLYIKYDGITNYYHTPYLIDLITKGSVIIPELNVIIPESFILPEQRELLYVPGSPTAKVTVFGDVVTPGFFEEFLTAENVLRRPYGSAEQNMFNFAYNLHTLRFKKDSKQLSDDILRRTLRYLNVAYQRQLSYMTTEGGMKMFRDDQQSSIWLTAFAARTLSEARFGEWEQDLFIPLELINSMVLWLCDKQNETGAFNESMNHPVYDRKLARSDDQLDVMSNNPLPLTAYVLIALQKITGTSGSAQSCIEISRQRAASYLTNHVSDIDPVKDVFHLAISAYALSLTQEKSRAAYDVLYRQRRLGQEELYWADDVVPENPSSMQNGMRYLDPRIELKNDAYAVQTTAYALLSLINHDGLKYERDSAMRWLNSMRNTNGGFASTQDTLAAMEALIAYTQVDPNRNVFDMSVTIQSTSTANWKAFNILTRTNYTNLQVSNIPNVHGHVRVNSQGAGRSMLQLSATMNVEYQWQLKPPAEKSFEITMKETWGGRNSSMMEIVACSRWVYLEKSLRSGMAVLEVDIPTGFVTMNDTLRSYVQLGVVRNLRRAESYYRKVVFYFDYLDQQDTCVRFKANQWYPVANSTRQNQIRVFDYYEPGLHNTTLYTTFTLGNRNLCWACASFQCPYCPIFNAATIITSSFTLLCLIVAYFTKFYLVLT